jgi:hypothetical protein
MSAELERDLLGPRRVRYYPLLPGSFLIHSSRPDRPFNIQLLSATIDMTHNIPILSTWQESKKRQPWLFRMHNQAR